MNNNLLYLNNIFNINEFQIVQDDIANAINMAIILVDYRGNSVTNHSNCSEFCSKIRKNKNSRKYCNKCDSRGVIEAARTQNPYIYICHMGIIDFAIPIIINGQYLGSLMCGQILLENDDEYQKLEPIIVNNNIILNYTDNEYFKLFSKLPKTNLEKIESTAKMLKHIVNYAIKDSILKYSLNDINTTYNTNYTKKIDFSKDFIHIQNDKLYTNKKEHKGENKYTGNVIIEPAIDYIHNNYNIKMNLEKMASMCNISTSYFSKLFKKETGYNFSNYVNNIKIIKAKEMLENTNQPIVNISLDLGYDDCGYFIKVFKKHLGITPSFYRKNIKNNI